MFVFFQTAAILDCSGLPAGRMPPDGVVPWSRSLRLVVGSVAGGSNGACGSQSGLANAQIGEALLTAWSPPQLQ